MSHSINVAVAFLGGTIISTEGGYRVLQHPKQDHIFNRLADARWFLAVHWCDQFPTPAGILTHDGEVPFQNHAALAIGDRVFLPSQFRKTIFNLCLTLTPGAFATYVIEETSQSDERKLEIMGLDIDPRYGRVALIKTQHLDSLAPF